MRTRPARSPATANFSSPRHRRSLAQDRRAGIAISAALMMPVMLGMVGLGVEASSWMEQTVQLQRIADVAALSAAKLLNAGQTAQAAATAAANLAEVNGIPSASRSWSSGTNTLSDTYLSVQLVSGIRNSSDQAFKVTVQRPVSLYLAKMFVSAQSLTLKASAWAEIISSAAVTPQPCLVGLAHEATPGSVYGISFSGSGALNGSGCALRSNSDIMISNQGLSLSVSGAYSGGTVTVSNGSFLTSANGVFSANDVNVSGGAGITSNVYSNGSTSVTGGSYIHGSVAAGGNISMNGGSTITGNTASSGTTTVDGNSTLTGNAAANQVSVPNGTINGNTATVSADVINQWSGHVTGTKSSGTDPTSPGSPGTIPDPYASNSAVTTALGKLGGSSPGGAINIGWAANKVVLQPGTYSSITLADWATFGSGSAVTFAPGTYYVNGDVNLSGYVAGSGVTIVASGRVMINAGTVSLSAPLAGASSGIPGMLLVGNTSQAFTLLSSGNTASLVGVIYFPKAAVSVNGGVTANNTGCLEMMAATISVSGGTMLGANCAAYGAATFSATPGITSVALVE